MQTTVKTAALVAAAVLGTAGAVWAVPAVSNVDMEQIPDTRWVRINYTLADEDAIVTLSIETNGVAIPDSAVTWLSGDVCKVVKPGTGKSIMWNAGFDWPENVTGNAKARVTAWCTNTPPQYCAVDVAGGPAAETYPVYYYTSSNAVPRGVTSDLYKTYSILMRRIESTDSEGFMMGSPSDEAGRQAVREAQVKVVLTKGFYAGVYQVTQGQWQQVMGDTHPWPAYFNNPNYRRMRPVDQVSHYDIRENANDTHDPAADWPLNNVVTAGSFMGRLRHKTGLAGFDLPTEAQWEYACRAGTDGPYNDGAYGDYEARLALLGRYKNNGGTGSAQDCGPEKGTAIVGSYVPNRWGLYDMHGNVWEWCLDWYANDREGGTDPRGAVSNYDSGQRASRGGGSDDYSVNSRSAFRNDWGPSWLRGGMGFRLFRTLP